MLLRGVRIFSRIYFFATKLHKLRWPTSVTAKLSYRGKTLICPCTTSISAAKLQFLTAKRQCLTAKLQFSTAKLQCLTAKLQCLTAKLQCLTAKLLSISHGKTSISHRKTLFSTAKLQAWSSLTGRDWS